MTRPWLDNGWRYMDCAEAESIRRALLDFGYAPGGYIIKCYDCKEQSWHCDKRALRCKECAEKRLNDSLAMHQGLE